MSAMDGSRGISGQRNTAHEGATFYRQSRRRRVRARSFLQRSLVGALLVGSASCKAIENLDFYSLEEGAAMGAVAFDQVKSEAKVVSSGSQHDQVQRVVGRLVEATSRFRPEMVEAFEWEVELLDEPDTVNAFALPGGKMAVYTGILPVAETDAGLAVVLGHEIAHVTESHGTKKLTKSNIANFGSLAYVALRGEDVTEAEAAVVQITSTLTLLKYGRGAELEADQLGLMIMAEAGYDPREAVAFWSRMESLSANRPIEFLSTHPSHSTRIEELEAMMPEALSIWQEKQP